MGTTLEIQQDLTIARSLPTASADTSAATMTPVRAGHYREQYALSLIPTTHLLSDEGSYFVATNPTPGSALSYNLQTTFSDTVPFLYLYNKDVTSNANYKRIYLHYIKLITTVAPASSVQAYFAAKLDNVARSLGTNNTTSITPVSPNMDLSPSSIATLNVQSSSTASAIAASSASARVIARGAVGGIPIVGDELVFQFGESAIGPYQGLTAAQATCPGRKMTSCPPVILGPGTSLTFHLWFPSNATTPLSYEFEMGWFER